MTDPLASALTAYLVALSPLATGIQNAITFPAAPSASPRWPPG